MYVREIKIKRGEGVWDRPWKVYSYWQLVRSYRDPDTGKVRKQVVRHLGKADDRQHADHLARRRGLLCSVEGCGREWAVEIEGRPENLMGRKYRRVWRTCEEHHDAWRRGEWSRGFPYMPDLYGSS